MTQLNVTESNGDFIVTNQKASFRLSWLIDLTSAHVRVVKATNRKHIELRNPLIRRQH